MLGSDHHHHANAVVKGAVHFDVVNAGGGLQPSKQLGLGPTAFVQVGGQAVGQDAGNVFEQAAARDVRQGFDGVLCQRSQHVLHIQSGRAHDGLFEGHAIERGGRVGAGALNALAHQAKTVGVHAVAGQAQHHVASLYVLARQNFAFLNRAHAKASQVVLACGVHAGHFGGFTANEGAATHFAALGNAADHRCGGVHVQFATGKVVQKEQRLGTLHQHIVHAHAHQVNAHGVVHVPFKRQLEFGAHTVGATHQHRFLVALGHFKQRAKAANTGHYALAQGFFGQGLDALNQRVASVNVNASIFIREGRCGHKRGADRIK